MRKIILNLAVSLDGFIEGPDQEIDWIVFDEEGGNALNKFLQGIDTILYGRISYEIWGNYTPPENASAFEKDLYGVTGRMAKYVFSSSKEKFEGNPVVVKSDIEDFIKTLKQQPGKNIWLYGGSGLITTFMNLNLVDEFRLAVIPVILGRGKPLFRDIQNRVKLKLTEVHAGKSGVLELSYEKVMD